MALGLAVKPASAEETVAILPCRPAPTADQYLAGGLAANALDDVTFPVARHERVLDFLQTHVDADHFWNLAKRSLQRPCGRRA